MLPRHLLLRAAAVSLLLPAVAGCGGEDDPAPEAAVHTAAGGEVFNDADAAFASDLVQHDALALVLVDLTRGTEVSPDLAAVAEDILTTEALEIETLVGWLDAWDLPEPATIRDHVNAHATERGEDPGEVPGGDLPGMPDHADLAELEALDGEAFERRWLELMIAHHEGAIRIAEAEAEDGLFDRAVDLAEQTAATNRSQLERMQTLLP